MADLTLDPTLVKRLQAIAEQEGRSVEETLTALIDRYEAQDALPGSTISDQEIVEIPPDPFDTLIGLFDESDLTDMSSPETAQRLRDEHYQKRQERWQP